MELFFTVFILLILFCLGAGWLLYQQMEMNNPRFYKGRFHALEHMLLREFIDLFEDDLGRKMKLQLKYFKTRGKYWRIENHDYHRVELYEEENNLMEEELLFPLGLSAELARIRFKVAGKDHMMIMRSFNGAVWGWDIQPNPGKQLLSSNADIIERKVLHHPEEFNKTSVETRVKIKHMENGFLYALLESPSLKEVRSPKNLGKLETQLRRTGTKLPEDFLSFLGFADGMIFENGKIHGSRSLLKIMTTEEEFWPLAEFRGELLGVRPGDRLGRVYIMNKKAKKLKAVKGDFSEHLLARLDTFDIRS